MYSEDDINSAVDAGALTPEAAASFRAHMSKLRSLPRGSEEDFRLLNSFNDIFVAIGIVILLIAVGAIGQAIASNFAPVPEYPFSDWDWSKGPAPANTPEETAWRAATNFRDALQTALAGLFVALAAWPLAEFFTRKRRMALPSIILLLAFVGGTFFAVFGTGQAIGQQTSEVFGALAIAASALVAAGAAFLHWRRFMVPITVAAGTGALAATFVALIVAAIGPDNIAEEAVFAVIFAAGLCVFALAMRWDMTDRERTTRRSDVAFWLHLLAAPMIAHSVFSLLGVNQGGDLGIGAALGVLAVYITFGLLALTIDRRALLVSALIYVLFALTFLFRQFGAVELNFALTALVIGSALLSLSAFWQPIRRAVVQVLPQSWQDNLPATDDLPVSADAPIPASPA